MTISCTSPPLTHLNQGLAEATPAEGIESDSQRAERRRDSRLRLNEALPSSDGDGAPPPEPRLHAAPGRAAALDRGHAVGVDRVPAARPRGDPFPGKGRPRRVRAARPVCDLR